jgi:hypothetical protein
LAVTVFLISTMFLFLVAVIRKIPLLSPYGIFVAFQILYNLAPWVTASQGISTPLFTLLGDMHLANVQLYLSASANLCFGLCFLLFYKRVRLQRPSDNNHSAKVIVFWTIFPLFLITLVLVHFYGWNKITFLTMGADETVAGGMFTVTSYMKYAFISSYLYYLYRYGFDKFAGMLLAEQTLVMLVDGARTTFLPIALLTLFVVGDAAQKQTRNVRLYIVAAISIFLSLLTRALILGGNSTFAEKVFAPVMIEGTMGDYSALQSLDSIMKGGKAYLHFTYGFSYIIDPILWFLPTGDLRNNLSFFQHWVDGITPYLQETYSPMGGFYYAAEATAAFSYAGPAIVTLCFGLWLVWMERNKNRFRMLYIASLPTLGLLFVKAIFGNLVKIFIIQLAMILCIALVFRLAQLLTIRPRPDDETSLPAPSHTY